jgi:4-hydroxy-3-methylbut-2-enyl diphosphate reductase
VHLDAERHHAAGREIVLIGHAGHPEVIGTLGQLPDDAISLIETVADAQGFSPKDPANLAFVTQTTLSVDDTSEIVGVLKARFPNISTPHREDICYATTNRQEAVKRIANGCDLVLVVGSRRSSNSQRLVEVAVRGGAKAAYLVDCADDIDPAWLSDAQVIGVTAGASAPEVLVDGVLDYFAQRFDVTIEETGAVRETVTFKLPRLLVEEA